MLWREERANNFFTLWVEIKLHLQRRDPMNNLHPLVRFTQEKLLHKATEDSLEELVKESQELLESVEVALTKKR